MNTIFGIWRPTGPPVGNEEFKELGTHTARFSSDGEFMRIVGAIGMGIQTWHTDLRSHLEEQPLKDDAGNLLVYDGRLDNCKELLGLLELDDNNLSDSEIILAAYRRWGKDCFAQLVGDWSLSLWDSKIRTLFLARDHAGTRTLFYSRADSGTVIWSTYLDSFLGTGLLDAPDPEYMSCYLAMLPCYRKTPYRDVQSVIPGQVLEIRESGILTHQYWTPLVHDELVFKSDDDYDERFLALFQQAVKRRTGPDAAVLAQLSGGMDSTSIVCTSDRLRKSSQNDVDLVDTLSYFDDSDPSWDEEPYFTIVEARRGKRGIHLDSSRYRASIDKSSNDEAFYLYPGTSQSDLRRDSDLLSSTSGRYRVMISGIGGDELTGGLVDPAAELADYIVEGKLAIAIKRATSWCVASQGNFFELSGKSIRYIPQHMGFAHVEHTLRDIPWLSKSAREVCSTAMRALPIPAYRLFAGRPSAIGVCRDWWYMLRTQPHLRPSEVYRYEYRYPYLDRDFVDFLLRVPLRQLAAPGRRRLMMRRALKGIVPEEILERRRKAFLLRSPLSQISDMAPKLRSLIQDSTLASLGYVEPTGLRKSLEDTLSGQEIRWWGLVLRYAHLETWLRHRARLCPSPQEFKVSAESYPTISADGVPAV